MATFRIKRKICAGALAFTVILGGCFSPAETETQTAAPTQSAAQTTSAAVIADEDELPRVEKKDPLRVAPGGHSYTYSPFYTDGKFDEFITSVTGVRLLPRDREGKAVTLGISGEKRLYAGSYYTYTGIAELTERYDSDKDETVYSLILREDICFSDGEPLDADDVIFTLYMLLDPSFSKISTLQGAGIKGEINYRLGSAIADSLTSEEIAEALETEEVRGRIRENIVVPLLEQEFEWVKSLYGESSYSVYTEAYPDPKDLMAFFYSVDSSYNSAEATEAQVLTDLADMYGGNYALLGSMYRGDASYFKTEAEICAIGWLSEQSENSEIVDYISGIEKTGRYSLDITVSGSSSQLPQLLTGVTVAPLHYYGSDGEYSYGEHRFGFAKGKALEIAQQKADKPLGAGAYCFDRSENGVVYLSANQKYYKGIPQVEKIEVLQVDGNEADAITDGTADITCPESSAKISEEIDKANEALEKLSAHVVSGDGYGFIGINAKTVNIGGKPDSEESSALRKALATAIFLNRDESVKRYCGEVGITANCPDVASSYLSGTEFSYSPPYCKDVNGEPIYTKYMSESERFEATKAACLGFFEAAGYTVSDNLIISPPEGGTTTFRAIIAAEGNGSHPSYYALTGAKRLLGEIGITLIITDTADASQLWNALSSGTQEIWASVWETKAQPRMSDMYGAGNFFGIENEEFTNFVTAADSSDGEDKRAAYAGCYGLLYDGWAVEIPVYQRSSCILFSTLRVDTESIPDNMTGYYDWTDEIEKIRQKN